MCDTPAARSSRWPAAESTEPLAPVPMRRAPELMSMRWPDVLFRRPLALADLMRLSAGGVVPGYTGSPVESAPMGGPLPARMSRGPVGAAPRLGGLAALVTAPPGLRTPRSHLACTATFLTWTAIERGHCPPLPVLTFPT
jgi:hypothetical protein